MQYIYESFGALFVHKQAIAGGSLGGEQGSKAKSSKLFAVLTRKLFSQTFSSPIFLYGVCSQEIKTCLIDATRKKGHRRTYTIAFKQRKLMGHSQLRA